MSDLPDGWEWATLGELCDAKPGFASGRHNSAGVGIAHIRPMNIARNGQLDLSDVRYVNDDSDRRTSQGDILFNNTNSPGLVGKTASVTLSDKLAYSNHITRLRANPEVCSYFIAWQLHHCWLRGYFKSVMSHHVNQASVSTRILVNIPLVLPPLPEQRRIVAALDAQKGRLDTGERYLYSAMKRAQAAKESILIQKTRATGPTSSLPEGWGSARIHELATVGTGCTPHKSHPEYYEHGTVPWVTSSALNSSVVTSSDQYVTEDALTQTSLRIYPTGTILVAMYGEGKTRGKCSELGIPATINQACAAITLTEEYKHLHHWVKLYLEASYQKNRNISSGGVQSNLNLKKVRNIEIPLPPQSTREAIELGVKHLYSKIDNTSISLERSYQRAEQLRRSLLRETFAGRLVPQDPHDEPASVLLERIRAERAQSSKGKRTSRAKKSAKTASQAASSESPDAENASQSASSDFDTSKPLPESPGRGTQDTLELDL